MPRLRAAFLFRCALSWLPAGGLLRAAFASIQPTTPNESATVAATPAELFALFDRLGIVHSTVEHPPFFTVEEGRPWHDKIPGLHCKNLFIKDRKGGIWLVVMPADKRADIGRLEKAVGAPRFSFARPEVLQQVLELTPGSVTPFGLINDKERRVTVIIDQEILDSERVNFHPLHNAASTTLRSMDLLRFVRALGYEPIIVHLPETPSEK
jgi:Ala-tRNA(Pro) deacylase